MTTKTWRVFIAFSISTLIILYPLAVTNGCGGGDEDGSDYFLFAPEVIKQPLYEPFFFAPYSHFYNDYAEYDSEPEADSLPSRDEADNLAEWSTYFKQPKEADLRALIYDAEKAQVVELTKALGQAKALATSSPLARNSVVQTILKNNDQEFANYLLFAKKCEPFVSLNAWENESRDSKAMNALIAEGKKQYALCKTEDMKLRYAFQAVRLAHYSGAYASCISLYNELVQPLPKDNVVKYWAMGHKAGALKATEKYPEAIYLYSRVFDKCPGRRKSAFGSVYFSRPEWQTASLNLCKNQEEKNTLLFLGSLEKTDYDLPTLQKIYQTTPNSSQLVVLLAREINKLEVERNGNFYYSPEEKTKPAVTATALKTFVVQAANNQNTVQPELWQFAAGYLSYLDQDFASARSFFKKASKSGGKDALLPSQIRIIEVMLKVAEAKKIDEKLENELLKEITWLKSDKTQYLRFTNAYTFLMNSLGKRYAKQENKLMSYLCFSQSSPGYHYRIFYNPETTFTQSIIGLMDKKNPTNFEKYLLKGFELTKDDLVELEGTILLSEHKFKEAIEKYHQIDTTKEGMMEKLTLPADPFVIHINDCHDCDFEAPKKKVYTKISFAEEMLNFEDLIAKDAKNAGQYNFFLGNGYYNISYYGNSWMAIDYASRSHGETDRIHLDCSKALSYYQKAMQLTKNKEFGAKCCFMASKCEQNAYYKFPSDSYEGQNPKQKREHFKLLKDNYNTTKYYQQAIAECGRFAKFVKQ